MKYGKYLKILAVSLTFALLVALVPATPALSATNLRITPESGEVGDEIEIYGSGFDDFSTLKFYFSDEKATTGDVIDTDIINYEYLGQKTVTDGYFEEFYFDVPSRLRDGEDVENVRSGTYYIYATDYYGEIVDRETFIVEAAAEIAIVPDDGPVGTVVEITGQGFGDREDIIVEYDGDAVDIDSGDEDTDSSGGFTCTILIPESTAGDHTITVTGDYSNTESADTFTVEPEITLSVTSGVAGQTLTVSGTGFGSRADYIIWFGNQEVENGTTRSDGSFEESFTIPSVGQGTYTIEVEDDENNDAEADFSVAATAITIDPTTGHVYTQITVSGTGFQANQQVNITFDNENVATTAAGGQGKVNTTFNVPVRAAGTYIVKVSDGINTAQAQFTITTSIDIAPKTSATSPGYIGTEITVSGVGYASGTQVTVTYDGTEVDSTTVAADGSFSARFNAPVSRGGQHTIIASIGTATETFAFFMDPTPPQWPQPLLPEMGAEAEAETYFDWEDVTDPSGVTYTLQIATSADFSQDSIVLEKPELIKSEYTLTKEERLKSVSPENPYYWHVRAVDGVSNEGQWSGTGEFYVSGGISWGLPKPVLYFLIALGVIVVIVLGFWLGRKTAYY